MKKAAVVGAAGFAGIEAARLLLGHPEFELTCVTSGADAGKPLAALYPALLGQTDLVFDAHDVDVIAAKAEVAFLAVPHTAALAMAPALVAAGVLVVDLSADFRLADAAVYEKWYGVPHTAPELLATTVYALPELARAEIAGCTQVVSCPGCYPTASALAAVPALEAGMLAAGGHVVVSAVSGVSGAGRSLSPKTHFCSANESAGAYGIPHRHTPEIKQTFERAAGEEVALTFVPHLIPMQRGLVATAYVPLAAGVAFEAVRAAYEERYANEPFVTLLPAGMMPQTGHVVGSNRAHVGVAYDEATHTLIASCAIDNLVKGAAGQAVQAANIACGFAETAGLTEVGPVV